MLYNSLVNRRRSALCAAVSSACLWATLAHAEEASPASDDEIIVTGEKIARSLKDTSPSVTVVRDIDPQQFKSPYDIASRVPNMISTAADLPSIRGVSGSGAGGGIFTLMSGARPRIGTFVDGVAESFAGQRYADAGMWDVDQVEVLRGPQSTTQGRNSLGGAIVITTKSPTFEWEGALRGGFETEGDTAYAGGMVSGPIVKDELAFRVAADATRGESYIDYSAGSGFPFDPSRIERTNLRGKLLWTPSSIPGLTVLATGTKRWNKGEYLYTVMGPDFWDYKWDNENYNTRTSDSTVGTASVDIGYELAQGIDFHLLYAHAWFDARFLQSNQNSSANSQGSLNLSEQNDTVEARLTYAPADSVLSGVVGLYYYDRHQDLASTLGVNGPDSTKTLAAYADGAVAVTDRLSVLFGGRIEREKQKRNVALSWGTVTADEAKTLFLPKAGLRYAVTDSTNVSATLRKGYSPGGGAIDWDTGDYYTYGAETVWAYEVGTRTELAGNKLTFGTTLFLNDYEGFQSLINYTFMNVPKVRTYGVEGEVQFRPWDGLEIYGSAGLLHSDIRKAPAGYESVEGNRLDNAPTFTGSLGFDQKFASGFGFGASVNHVSHYNSQVESGTAIEAGGYTVINANIGYQTEHFGLKLYVKNLGNERIIYSAKTRFGDDQAQIGQPRAFGITGDVRF